ncbi:MAG: phosphoribosyltransferase [Actinophytocola sp.]|uniref:phosphoribosyltransferase family protein n=1 Tax=Actinophytocola sp. TaxID=1872138 RepID=UPI00132B2EA5|nr:phosphoribosyltransferase family protein [Actinophytocola sp.]MPZ83235.1 phosphoribosyltransferase [Actinophytocola sp.]
MRFRDRADAGRRLAERLGHLRAENPVVVGLPRGGVPVAAEVAAALDAPLDIVLVRKIGAPHRMELAVGAIGEDGVTVRNDEVLAELGLTWAGLGGQISRERREIDRRAGSLRPGPRPSLDGRTVILVDDGIATGATVIAAIRVVRRLGARRIVLAVPVAPADTVARLREIADEVVCGLLPSRFLAVGQWYEDFAQVPDKRVRRLLEESATVADEPIVVCGRLPGHLFVPARPAGVVIFAHGSGSGRHSPRNVAVADSLHRAGFGTVLIDLLDEAEAGDRSKVFDIALLASRLRSVAAVVRDDRRLAGLPIGLFGASTGAAAALRAAAAPSPDVRVSAVVSRGGRPDLAAGSLPAVNAPTLLIVGGRDQEVLALNAAARRRLRCRTDLVVVPGAGHLFAEPGALDEVERLAVGWFEEHLGTRR